MGEKLKVRKIDLWSKVTEPGNNEVRIWIQVYPIPKSVYKPSCHMELSCQVPVSPGIEAHQSFRWGSSCVWCSTDTIFDMPGMNTQPLHFYGVTGQWPAELLPQFPADCYSSYPAASIGTWKPTWLFRVFRIPCHAPIWQGLEGNVS